ncbi:MAG: type II-A CRISPR-associated protein Csn2 [Andreesenia angusta]|nr:type II-A CRISPR-associated protein Csn2 [Andreesenia angusta]
MIFQHNSLDYDFNLEENNISVIIIENSIVYRNMLIELKKQLNGDEGGFLIRDGLKILDIKKKVEFIENLLELDLNSRNVKNKIYKYLEEESINYYYKEIMDLYDFIQKFIFLINENSDFEYSIENSIKITDILKSVDFSIEFEEKDIVNNIIRYMDLINSINNKEVFIFCNLKLFLTEEELNKVYDYTFQKKYYIILFERFESEHKNLKEKNFILDSDLCELY